MTATTKHYVMPMLVSVGIGYPIGAAVEYGAGAEGVRFGFYLLIGVVATSIAQKVWPHGR